MKKRKIICAFVFVISLFWLCACSKEEAVMITAQPEEDFLSREQPEEEKEETKEEVEEAKEETGSLMIHICGAVQCPGVYELTEGKRICHAVEAAGGFTEAADEDYLNQAGKLADGMRIYIPTKEETEGMQENPIQNNELFLGQPNDTSLVNINTATLEQLCTLPGIGEGKAQNIIAYRKESGGYASIEEIMNVEGIKEGLFKKIRDRITVS